LTYIEVLLEFFGGEMMSLVTRKLMASLVEINTKEGDSVDFFDSLVYKIVIFCRERGIGGEPLHIGRSLFRAYFTEPDYRTLASWLEEGGHKVL
jgi:hypothetical protein